ncbi:MAG: cellulase family glycosylhydrolase [Chloroflexota bacterium]|nr:cellulase family glycosylhydrolase [Chloroflexota bacterium]
MKYRVMPKLTSILLSVVIVTFIVATNASPLFARTVLPGTSPAPTTYTRPLIASTIPIGISYGDTLFWDNASVLSQTLDDAVAVGITTIRLDLDWGNIQPASASTYNWTNFDKVVLAAQSRHLTLLPILDYTPTWARPFGCTTDKCAPTNPNAFASFAAAASSRYAPMGIHTWEIWNEPNLVNFWQPTPNVNQYVQLLSLTSKAIRAVDPQAFIISGGLGPSDNSGGNISPLNFFGQFANSGGLSLVDAIGDHTYSFPVPPAYNASWNAWQQMAGTSLNFESILVAHGVTNKKIWITEYGAPTNGPGAIATPSNYNLTLHPDHVNEALQAQMAKDSVCLARSSSYIGALYWYSYKDLGTDKSNTENFFGLRRFDGSAKLGWQSLQQAILATNILSTPTTYATGGCTQDHEAVNGPKVGKKENLPIILKGGKSRMSQASRKKTKNDLVEKFFNDKDHGYKPCNYLPKRPSPSYANQLTGGKGVRQPQC